VEDIRTLAVGEFVPARLKESRRHRPNEPPVGSLPANLAAATVNEMFFPLAVVLFNDFKARLEKNAENAL
jgi:hypothetical protein